jgi:tRNA G18 (ribose-2'-O)-methylase SpoU
MRYNDSMPATILPVDNLDDPRLHLYRNVKDRDIARSGGRFIAEGEKLVRRLLTSKYVTESVLLCPRLLEEFRPLFPDGTLVFVAPESVMSTILGFKFHTGAIAIGLRGESPAIESLGIAQREKFLIVVAPDLNNGANLGGLIRSAAGMGADAFLVGPRSVDPYCRYSVRVSMGACYTLPILWSTDLLADLRELKSLGVSLIGSVLGHGAGPLAGFVAPSKSALLLGSEAHGLDEPTIALCDHLLTIPMSHDTDSLNVTIAGAIFLWQMTSQRELTARPAS